MCKILKTGTPTKKQQPSFDTARAINQRATKHKQDMKLLNTDGDFVSLSPDAMGETRFVQRSSPEVWPRKSKRLPSLKYPNGQLKLDSPFPPCCTITNLRDLQCKRLDPRIRFTVYRCYAPVLGAIAPGAGIGRYGQSPKCLFVGVPSCLGSHGS